MAEADPRAGRRQAGRPEVNETVKDSNEPQAAGIQNENAESVPGARTQLIRSRQVRNPSEAEFRRRRKRQQAENEPLGGSRQNAAGRYARQRARVYEGGTAERRQRRRNDPTAKIQAFKQKAGEKRIRDVKAFQQNGRRRQQAGGSEHRAGRIPERERTQVAETPTAENRWRLQKTQAGRRWQAEICRRKMHPAECKVQVRWQVTAAVELHPDRPRQKREPGSNLRQVTADPR